MSKRTPYVCEYCTAEWASPISAAMCCDALSLDLDDDRYRSNN